MGQSHILFSSAARNLGVIFHSQLALKEQVYKLCQLAYLEIRGIGSNRQYLFFEVTKTLVSSFGPSRLDYCNSFLAGSPQVLRIKIQRVINSSARLICKAPKSDHITRLRSQMATNGFNTKRLSSASKLSLVQLLHTPLSCFISTLLLSLSLLSLLYWDITRFQCGQEDPGGEMLSINWTCDLELSISLCRAFVFTLFF